MKIVNRPRRTTPELIALINQRQADWWPVMAGRTFSIVFGL
jgi:hypothetical protein